MLKMIVIFSVCSIVNVMLNTIKTIIMYRNEKISSALINAITYGFYTVVVVLMAGEMALWLKMILTAATNFIGVWLSMCIMDKINKDKLWKVEITVKTDQAEFADRALFEEHIKYSPLPLNNGWYTFHCYCENKQETAICKEIAKSYDGKISAYESKSL